MLSTNHPTATAVDAFRKVVRLEKRLENAQQELSQALSNPDVIIEDYFVLTDQIETAASEGRAVHNVGLVDHVRPIGE